MFEKSAKTSIKPRLVDNFGRQINYLRLSVTDRCDFRCVYCMAEEMEFMPRQEILSLEELAMIGRAFCELGVSKIRLTGGEPLVRNNILSLIEELGHQPGLDELVITSNGSQLTRLAPSLLEAGVKRINISLDSLRPDRFRAITRTGELSKVLAGIDAARTAGFENIKINTVILKGRNDDEIVELVDFCQQHELDISFIEEMPLGLVDNNRALRFCSSAEIRQRLAPHYNLIDSDDDSGGPSHYYHVAGSKSRIGFISPHTDNFCHLCNRARVTVDGRLLLCLGNDHSVDLRQLLRQQPGDIEALKQRIVEAMTFKPEKHDFTLDQEPQILRFMNMTGG